MKSDFEMIVHHFDNDITVYPISDIHLGAAEHCEEAWQKFVDELQNKKDTYIILNGDLINNATRSSVSDIFEETMRPREQKRRIAEMLEPIRDKILCAVSGNHEARSMKDVDDDPVYDIMCKLDLEDLYRPNMAFIKIMLGTDNKRDQCDRAKSCYTIGVTHGTGGGINTGSSVNRNEKFGNVIEGLDCLVVGHTHKGVVSKPGKLIVDARRNYVYERHYTVISSVSWMNFGGYALKKMLSPSHVCNPQYFTLKKNSKNLTVVW